ncbi:hypothetical protein CAP48_08045 [Advenella sp. S44]|uniref:DUF4142 domain-containing protein n=1 Tax=Advenella sp. S44 TaxID=1982755 RepID=UPI000C2A4064|nr:DUF4142 domain-containing protein [Advenella sp. S44]PJX25968.1 hypothetical protein CAP48_08045 [Advenella sp. S44]
MFRLSCKTIVLLSSLMILPVSASAQSTNPANMGSDTNSTKTENTLSGDDKSFFNNAAEAGLAEVEGGKLAQQKASTSEVKDFAARMVTDHGKVNEELKALAESKGATVSTEPSLMQKGELKALSLLDDKFDENYVDRMGVAAHESTIELFQDTIKNSEDADIKAFAEKTLPSLQEHLKMAQDLNPTVSKAKAQP